jgi:uncharacterized protein YyaL (SSP411 family)
MTSPNPQNRLIREKNPYLRQHAHNPVDWYPWGDEAFERARREDKPVFLSIGYSSCHWCHVMEQESFSDPEVARLLNGTFVCVKVDREERPDLDQHFMTIGQMLTGTGGWPLTIVMTPDKRPFFAGTYFPKERRWGRIGLMELIPRLGDAWRTRRKEVLRSAEGMIDAVVQAQGERGERRGTGRSELTTETLDEAFRELEADFDELNGGFGSAPKFPVAHNVSFLLRYWKRTGNARALAMAEKTLEKMALGGIWDHLGSGFHRYSTDAEWRVPHFEKMLYDQALLADVYGEALAATGKGIFMRPAAETLEYVLRDLGAPEGGFYTAEDADSEGEEGRFYIWTKAEIEAVLNGEDAALAARVFELRAEGNFSDPGGSKDGRNILYLKQPLAEIAAERGIPTERLEAQVASIRARLLQAREERVRPFRDTKVLADWNGLAIGALAKASRATCEKRFLGAAEAAARFVLEKMRGPEGRLLHAFMEGEARIPAYLDDYAFLIRGLIEVYEAGFDPSFLERAIELTNVAIEDFADAKDGGFFSVTVATELPVRPKEVTDGAIPSGNSVMLMNLLRLARLTGSRDLEEAAARLTEAFSVKVTSQPRAHTAFLCGLDYALGPAAEVVVVGRSGEGRTEALLSALARTWLPNAVMLFKPTEARVKAGPRKTGMIVKLAPFTRDMKEIDGRPAAFVCTNGRCLKPVTSPDALLRLLDRGA